LTSARNGSGTNGAGASLHSAWSAEMSARTSSSGATPRRAETIATD
jgi:hypothetical protein